MEEKFFDTLALLPLTLSPRDMLRETLGDLPISGGWGYGPDDAIIVEDDDAMESAASDYDIIKQRTVLEIKDMVGEREFEIKGFHDIRQQQYLVNGVYYDVIECKIDVKWKDNGNISTYDKECWFNITQPFGKH